MLSIFRKHIDQRESGIERKENIGDEYSQVNGCVRRELRRNLGHT